MVSVIDEIDKLDFLKICDVYKDDLERKRKIRHRLIAKSEGATLVKQEYLRYLEDVFFGQYNGKLFVYQDYDRYLSAVCIEPFKDGLLLDSLVTVPEARRRGYAKKLIDYALDYCKTRPVYAHIHYNNKASRLLHEKIGFSLLCEYAHMLDGSIRNDHFTYIVK